MHTLVFWAAALSLIPLTAGIALELLGRLRDGMAPPTTGHPQAAPHRSPGAASLGPNPVTPN